MPKPAARLNNLQPYIFVTINQKIRELQAEGISVIRMDVGSPDMPPHPKVVEELAIRASDERLHGYSGYTGTPGFRQAIAEYYQRRFEVDLDPDTEVLPLIGSKEGVANMSFAYLDRGDVALVPDIGYPAYSMTAELAGGDVCWVPVDMSNEAQLRLEEIPQDALDRAKILWINYPNNPTGAVADLAYYEKVVTFCREHDILLVSDNPYMDVTFETYVAPSVLQIDGAKDIAVEMMSFSKTYNMAGWRMGAALGSSEALRNLLRVKSNVDSGHFLPIYDAGITALEKVPGSWIAERNDIYRQRRDLIMETLPEIGLSAETPKGSLYVWAKVEDGDGDSYTRDALQYAKVSIAPGSAYGPGGKQYVRFSLGITDEKLEHALENLKTWYNSQ